MNYNTFFLDIYFLRNITTFNWYCPYTKMLNIILSNLIQIYHL